jgi:hypothetical protein
MTTRKFPARGSIERKHQKQLLLLDDLYDLMSFDTETLFASSMLATDTMTNGTIAKYISEFLDLGILNRRLEYRVGKDERGVSVAGGRAYYYTLAKPKEEAQDLLNKKVAKDLADAEATFFASVVPAAQKRSKTMKQQMQQQESVVPIKPSTDLAVRVDRDQPVEAIAGPDKPNPFAVLAPMRKDESYALVAAARQYNQRDTKVNERIEGLLRQAKEFGLTVDETALRASITIQRDERLDTVSLVLPYIDLIESQLANYQEQNERLRTQLSAMEKTQREIISLREQNRRLMAKQVVQ